MPTLLSAIAGPGSAPAVIIPGEPATVVSRSGLVAAFEEAQKKLAQLGIGRGSKVAVAVPNSYEFVVLFLAISAQRAVVAPLNPAFRQPEFEFFLDDLRVAAVIVPADVVKKGGEVVRAAETAKVPVVQVARSGDRTIITALDAQQRLQAQPIEAAEENDVALVLHTSGTTGRPKTVPLTHANITRTMANIQATYQLNPTDRSLLVMPLFHIHGLVAGLLAPLGSGGSVIVPSRFSASTFWRDYTEQKATWYTAVPTIHQILLDAAAPSLLPPIRFIRSCSSPLAPAVFRALEDKFKAPVLEAYAMTEAAHQIASNPLPPAARQAGSVGIPQGVEVRVMAPLLEGDDPAAADDSALPVDVEGEICIRGPNVTIGYLANQEANIKAFTPASRFFRTGDSGKLTKDGYLILTGRLKEMINRGGEKISPVEIDNTIVQHPAVAEVTAFAIPDKLYGQSVGIAVVRRAGQRLSGPELRLWLDSRLAGFKVPERVYFTKVMPKNATGKIQRHRVAAAMLGKTSEQSTADGDDLVPPPRVRKGAKL